MWTEPMQGRWVCPRCFESNEAEADRCPTCGLERGADPTTAAATPGVPPAEPGAEAAPSGTPTAPAAPAPPWASAPSPESQRPGWLQLVLRFWWVGLLVIVGGIAAVDYLGGSRSITDMGVGDCFDVAEPDVETIGDVTQRECTEPHQYEMYYVGDLPDGEYPSQADINVWLEANCLPAFDAYVGIDYQSSALFALHLTPTEDGWNDGDHSVQCALHDPNDPELTESLRNAAR
jgi:hypothetical protein